MKINNKGFTMVELLVAMAIMGLLIIMAFPTIRAIQSNNTSTKYKEYGKSVLSASKLYVDSYEEDLFDLNDNNGMKSIDLNDLVKKDLLKDISMSDSTCLNGSSVNIIKYKDDYTYCLNLICTTGGKEVYKEITKEGKCKDLTLYKVTYSYGSNNHVVSAIQGNNHSVLTPGAAHISIPNGYKFVKWISDIGEKKPGEVIEVNSDITFTPELESYKYIIRYKSSLDSTVTGTQTCTVGKSCKLQANSYTKDYLSFTGYKYNNVDYSVGSEMKGVFNITQNNQVVDVTAKFRKNKITINYYSNGATLKPNVDQRCAIQAGCPKNDSKCYWKTHWTEVSGCKAKSGLVQTVQMNFDGTNFSKSKNGMPNYDDKNGSALYMTRSGCTGTNYWHIGSATSSNKINEYHTQKNSSFETMASFASDSRVGKGEAFKKGDVTVDVFAGWNCPNTIKCNAGTYLPKNKTSCATCTAGNYCVGGEFNKSTTKDQGLTPCPGTYKDGGTGLKNISSCALKVKAGYQVPKAKQGAVKCSKTYHSTASTIKYGEIYNCTKNTITLKYYENGGKLTPGRSQRCMKKACNNFKNHALCKCTKYTSDVNVNDAKNCINYSGTCDKESGVALVATNVLDTQYYSDGVRNYSDESGATIYMTRTGYTATGNWYVGSTGSSKTINENATYKNEEDYIKNGFGKTYWDNYQTNNITIKLYAGWKVSSYTLKFNKEGGTGKCDDIKKDYNTAWGTLCSPTKTGYTFGGWYTGKNGSGTKITKTSKATSNLTVHAKWTPIQYTIKVVKKDSNIKSIKIGGTTTTSKKVDYGSKVKIEAITKDYYHVEWKHGSDKSTTNPLTITVTGNATYNAYSDKNQLIIHYYANGGKITAGPKQICPGDKRCKESTGHIYKGTPDDYDATVLKNTDGLRNYRYKSNSTLYLTRKNCTATGVWHVDSPSGKAVSEVGSYDQIKDLAKASGYESKFKKGNVEIKYYAGWKCS